MKPIIFNTEMVRAIMDGRKCVTRRVIKPQPKGHAALISKNLIPETVEAGTGAAFAFEDGTVVGCPFKEGDILYVRETWAITSEIRDIEEEGPVYMADFTEQELRHLKDKHFRWRTSIHMPKELARIFLRVTNVRAERLQNITADGALLEGVELSQNKMTARERENYYPALFAALWDTTVRPDKIKKYGWDANPWVWAIRFEVCEKPEDAE